MSEGEYLGFFMATASVSSITNCSEAGAWLSNNCVSVLTKSACSNGGAEILTDTQGIGMFSDCQRLICCRDSLSTHFPIRIMSPDSSAMGINSVGGMLPKSGECQRNSASTPMILPVLSCTWG